MIEGSGIGMTETVLQHMPEKAGELLKKIANGESGDKGAPYLDLLEARGYVKDGRITKSGNDVLPLLSKGTEKASPKSRIKRI